MEANAGAGVPDRVFQAVSICALPNGCAGRNPARLSVRLCRVSAYGPAGGEKAALAV